MRVLEHARIRVGGERIEKLSVRLGIHSAEYKANDREAMNLTSEQKAEIRERKETMANAKRDVINPA